MSNNITTTDFAILEHEIRSFDIYNAPASGALGAHDLYLLEQAGFRVIQVVTGNVVYSMGLKGLLRNVQRAFVRGEMPDFTAMIRDARVLARNRLLAEAAALGADGVIDFAWTTQEFADFLEVVATGTAIKRVATSAAVDVAVGA